MTEVTFQSSVHNDGRKRNQMLQEANTSMSGWAGAALISKRSRFLSVKCFQRSIKGRNGFEDERG